MSDNPLADAFAKHIPKDQLFFFATIEKNGSLSILTSIQSIGARIELLDKILAQYQEERPNVQPRCPNGSPDWDTHMRLCGGCEDCEIYR